LRTEEARSLTKSLAGIFFRSGASAAIYLLSAWVTFSLLAVTPPLSTVTVENLLAALVLTAVVYLIHHVVNLATAASAGLGVAAALRTTVPRSTLAELLAAPASLLLVVALQRLGWSTFALMALLYMGTMVLAWQGGVDRERLRRRLADLERLHRAGETLSGTLEFRDLLRRLHLTIRDVVPFTKMFLVLEDAGRRARRVYAFDAEGRRGNSGGETVVEMLGRSEGLQANPEGGGVLIKDLPVGDGAAARLRLDFERGCLPADHRLALLDTVCRQAAAALGNAQLYRLANTDPLTGLAIRRSFERVLHRLAARGEHFAVIMLDLDWFKRVNDELGHRAGDEVLLDLAEVLQGSLRPLDSAVRYGGEEFVVLLPSVSSPEAAAVAERIRRTLEQRRLVFEGHEIRYTASFGVAESAAEPGLGDPMEVVWQADAALLAAKRAGRNQVVTAASL
ncbi:MAG: GGDEF domain-containing protein, partial [Acidobacteria bacterium]|nr:GGDEF domain-containing protein [Acidobacteriota bacterium]